MAKNTKLIRRIDDAILADAPYLVIQDETMETLAVGKIHARRSVPNGLMIACGMWEVILYTDVGYTIRELVSPSLNEYGRESRG